MLAPLVPGDRRGGDWRDRPPSEGRQGGETGGDRPWDFERLLVNWIEAGGDPDAYWRQTPRLLALFFEGKASAAKTERRNRAWLAWHSGYLSQARKLPSLDELIGEDAPPPRRQTPAEQLALAMRWNEQLGGKVIYRDE